MKAHILIIDEDDSCAALARELLQSLGYAVSTAFSVREGIAFSASVRPDLILLDIVTPELGGLQAIRALQAAPETKDAPILAFACRARDASAAAESLAAVDFIPKILSQDVLQPNIQRLLAAA